MAARKGSKHADSAEDYTSHPSYQGIGLISVGEQKRGRVGGNETRIAG